MLILLIVLSVFVIAKAIQIDKQKSKVQKRQANIERTLRQQQEDAREWTRRQIELEREQIRQAKELEKHEAWLVKHDEEIRKLKRKIEKADGDIEHWKEQLGNLYALLDVAQGELEQSIIGGKNQSKYQKQVVTLSNQIHTAENRLADAKFIKEEAERKLEVA